LNAGHTAPPNPLSPGVAAAAQQTTPHARWQAALLREHLAELEAQAATVREQIAALDEKPAG